MAGQSGQIIIRSDALKEAANSIQEMIIEIKRLVTNISLTVDDSNGAYGQGDVDRQGILDSADDIMETLADNAETLDFDIQAILAFATTLENSSSNS